MKKILITTVAALALMLSTTACNRSSDPRVAIKQYFPEQYSRALAVATCESSLNPKAVSPGGGNWGLFQINRIHERELNAMGYSWSRITDPYVNSKFARHLWNQTGWSAWSCG